MQIEEAHIGLTLLVFFRDFQAHVINNRKKNGIKHFPSENVKKYYKIFNFQGVKLPKNS